MAAKLDQKISGIEARRKKELDKIQIESNELEERYEKGTIRYDKWVEKEDALRNGMREVHLNCLEEIDYNNVMNDLLRSVLRGERLFLERLKQGSPHANLFGNWVRRIHNQVFTNFGMQLTPVPQAVIQRPNVRINPKEPNYGSFSSYQHDFTFGDPGVPTENNELLKYNSVADVMSFGVRYPWGRNNKS